MLACSGFSYDALLAQPPCKQCLTNAVIDLVRAGMIKLIAFEINLCAFAMFGDACGKV